MTIGRMGLGSARSRIWVLGSAAVAVACALLAIGASPARATFPGENGLIAFTGGGLHVTTPSGRVSTLIREIGPRPHYPYPIDPEFLPSGDTIVYAYGDVWSGSRTDIYLSSADGSELTNLTAGSAFGGEPSPSPAGEIVFVRRTGFVPQALFVMDIDGTDVRQITPGAALDESPAWSPDGDRIVFARTPLGDDGYTEGPPHLFAVDPDGSDLTKLADGTGTYLSRPSFTPDGDHILFLRDGLVHVMNEDGTNPRRVADSRIARNINDVVTSPDNERLGFTRTFYSNCDMWGCNESNSLLTSAADGSHAHIVHGGGNDLSWGPLPEGGLPRPDATCDGRVASIVGTPLPDTIIGTRRGDVIAGLGGEDSINGQEGGDVICGGEGEQFLNGYGGPDLLIPGPGRDDVRSHTGRDSISLRDGARDRVKCGKGRDLVRADPIDEVASNCERVRR
jgi:WD40-like Beta Propeller Repeat/RTX calcium-binding nonapeptide repeat (4 copies)